MYQNPFTPGYEVLSKSGYSVDSSLGSSAAYLFTNHFPDYAAMFYSPTEHETISSIKYGNFEQDYDNLRDIQESLNGPPIEFYVPSSFAVSDGSGTQDVIVDPEKIREKLIERASKESMQEIIKAQREVKGNIKRIEFEDVLLLRKIKRTIIFDDTPENL